MVVDGWSRSLRTAPAPGQPDGSPPDPCPRGRPPPTLVSAPPGGFLRVRCPGLPPGFRISPCGRCPLSPSRDPTDAPSSLRQEVQAIVALQDPVLRNLRITLGYHRLAVDLADHLGEGGSGNWCAFAVWASKQAGRTIRKEDLLDAVRRRLGDDPLVETAMHTVVTAARALGSRRTIVELRRSLGGILDLPAIVDRTADAVGRGNRRVFHEVGERVAAFLDGAGGAGPESPAPATWSPPDTRGAPPPPGGFGEDLLSRALSRYAAVRAEADPRRRAQLLFLGNLEIGVHEQIRVQPEIQESVDVVVPVARVLRERIRSVLFPGNPMLFRLRDGFWRMRNRTGPLDRALDALVEVVGARVRVILTRELMTMDLAGVATLRLGEDLPGTIPDGLRELDHPELLDLLSRVDPTPDDLRGTGARDWSDLAERLHFIADLFRCHQETPQLVSPPYDPIQVGEILAGRLPPPPL